MSRKKAFKYDLIIYICLFIGFTCAIVSCIEPSSAKSEIISETESKNITEENKEPQEVLKIDKYNIAQKYIDSIIDQIIVDNIITYEMVTTWTTYSITNMKYQKEIMDDYYLYEVEIKLTGTNISIPSEKIIVEKTNEYTIIKVNMNLYYSPIRNGYLIKSIEIPSET